eukprot:4706071-Pleurochrysis_carterae.AAC.1
MKAQATTQRREAPAQAQVSTRTPTASPWEVAGFTNRARKVDSKDQSWRLPLAHAAKELARGRTFALLSHATYSSPG